MAYSKETQNLVGFLKEIGASDIRVYSEGEAEKANPANLSPAARRLLIRERNSRPKSQ